MHTPTTISDHPNALLRVMLICMRGLPNDERMHHYQRGRASITGLMVELREIIDTGRLVVVVMTRLVLLSFLYCNLMTVN